MLQFTQARKRGLFGIPDPMTPGGGIGGGMDGAVQETAPGNPGSSVEPRKKRGLFGSPVVKGIAGTVGDFLLQQAEMAPVYAPQMQLRQKMEAEEQQYQRRRSSELEDYGKKQEIEARYRAPQTPYRFEDNAGNVYERDPATGENRLIFTDPNDKVFMQDGQMITVPNRVRTQSATPEGTAMPTATDEATYNAIPPGAQYRTPDGHIRVKGGAAAPAARPFDGKPRGAPPLRLNSGFMTSGKRTPEGNVAVGGVPNSKHLTGEAADYWGNDLGAVLREARGLPGVRKAFIHGKGGKRHVHTEGEWNAPYVGRRGTKGLKR